MKELDIEAEVRDSKKETLISLCEALGLDTSGKANEIASRVLGTVKDNPEQRIKALAFYEAKYEAANAEVKEPEVKTPDTPVAPAEEKKQYSPGQFYVPKNPGATVSVGGFCVSDAGIPVNEHTTILESWVDSLVIKVDRK
jgi:hypothetical protein